MSDESKFNFSEEEEQQVNKEKAVEEKKEAVKQDAKGLFSSISGLVFPFPTHKKGYICCHFQKIKLLQGASWSSVV